MSRRAAWAALLALAAAAPAAAQRPRPARDLGPPPPGIAVVRRPGATLVAATVVIPAGSADDPADLPGLARLTGDAVGEAVRWRLGADAARLDVRVERGWTAFTLLATQDVWAHSWGVLEDVLFRVPLTSAPIEAARAALLRTFTFEEGAPVREFQAELYRTLAGRARAWGHDPRGDPAALDAAPPAAVDGFRARAYRMATATAAVVGPVSEAEATGTLAPLGTSPLPERPFGDDMAWDDGDRVRLERPVTNTWIGALFPASADLPRTRLDFLAHEVREALNPSPPDPGLFSADVRVEDTPAGPVLVVQAAVMPEVTEAWERRIVAAVTSLEREAEPGFFGYRRRRFRNAMLLDEGLPERAALRMALDLQREGRVRPLLDELWEITPRALSDAAGEMGEPRLLVMGPVLP